MSIDFPQFMATCAHALAWVVIGVGLMQSLIHVVQLMLAARALAANPPEAQSNALWRRYADSTPPISLLAPAFNEATSVVQSARSLLSLRYPSFEVIVINDGSGDATLDVLIEAFNLSPVSRAYEATIPTECIRGLYASEMHPRLLVVDKANGGKSDALNAGVNLARAPIVCSIDADSLLEPDALLRAVQPFLEDPERVVAVGGTVRVGNGCRTDHGQIVSIGVPRNLLALFQTVEYLRAFLMARLGWSHIGALTIISGAFGMFRRRAIIEVGGYSRGTVGEDMELVVKLHRYYRDQNKPYRIAFVPEPVCWTEVPETLAVLSRQRARWHRGALETFARHVGLLFNPRYGRVGVFGLGAVLVVDVLGPVAEFIGYMLLPAFSALGQLASEYLFAFLALNIAFGVALSVGALALEEVELRRVSSARDLVVLLGAAILENFGYRQLNTLWRVRGLCEWASGAQSWGVMTRRGFQPASATLRN